MYNNEGWQSYGPQEPYCTEIKLKSNNQNTTYWKLTTKSWTTSNRIRVETMINQQITAVKTYNKIRIDEWLAQREAPLVLCQPWQPWPSICRAHQLKRIYPNIRPRNHWKHGCFVNSASHWRLWRKTGCQSDFHTVQAVLLLRTCLAAIYHPQASPLQLTNKR